MGGRKGIRNKLHREKMQMGYLMVWCPGRAEAHKTGYAKKHRVIMSDYLGRPLLRTEIVHHKNGNKLDNRIENLQILSNSEHTSLHVKGVKAPRHGSTKCVIEGCETLQKSKYKMCNKHYKAAWKRGE